MILQYITSSGKWRTFFKNSTRAGQGAGAEWICGIFRGLYACSAASISRQRTLSDGSSVAGPAAAASKLCIHVRLRNTTTEMPKRIHSSNDKMK